MRLWCDIATLTSLRSMHSEQSRTLVALPRQHCVVQHNVYALLLKLSDTCCDLLTAVLQIFSLKVSQNNMWGPLPEWCTYVVGL